MLEYKARCQMNQVFKEIVGLGDRKFKQVGATVHVMTLKKAVCMLLCVVLREYEGE